MILISYFLKVLMWKKIFKKIFYLTEVKQNPLVGSPLVTNQQEGKSEEEEEKSVTLPSKHLTPPPWTVQHSIHQSTHLRPSPSTVRHTLTTAGDIKIYTEKSSDRWIFSSIFTSHNHSFGGEESSQVSEF